jgi:hypothetical protein
VAPSDPGKGLDRVVVLAVLVGGIVRTRTWSVVRRSTSRVNGDFGGGVDAFGERQG